MNRKMTPDQTEALMAQLSRLAAEEFFSISGYILGHHKDGSSKQWPVEWHVETLPYHAVLTALADHCEDCEQCFTDGDGPTTCEQALVLEFAAQYEIDNQFVMSLLN